MRIKVDLKIGNFKSGSSNGELQIGIFAHRSHTLIISPNPCQPTHIVVLILTYKIYTFPSIFLYIIIIINIGHGPLDNM